MAKKFCFVINVTFDTPNGFVQKRYVRKTYLQVAKLLESFELLAISTNITYKRC